MEIENKQKRYKDGNNCTYSCQYHVIFCPKYKRGVLINGIETRLKELIKEKETDNQYTILEINIFPDHVHLIIDINPTIGIYPIITKIKKYTASILRKEFPKLKKKLPCLWTRSIFVSTVGSVSVETIKNYIEDQKNV